ncbi:XTP/dITP diphosphohydrolase [Nakamurella panacisegetis]|uniref:XTP/dITP diphosphohydrolase n=1 Tax=Nakamurella panacisegetis TaxID=1090615 RepID=A0A1H0IHZ1_9ACTN|nr:MazG family protein [Nakamurella panacisegetis]SDO31013.1 XTP/dITP diphosphohydrolase [Nakamurella panacisegetis]
MSSPESPLRQAVEVMDRLRSPGGCPWDAEQTHASLGRYLVEETYELLQAIEDEDEVAIREELGDVLLQVLFHARIAAERDRALGGFDVDDVAADLVDKLIRRHPHVFAGAEPIQDAADQQVRWDELKKAEHGRSSVVSGVALGQPAVALAAKLGARAARFGVEIDPPTGDSPAEQIFRIAYAAGAAGGDPESELRAVAKAHAARLADTETAAADQAPVTVSPHHVAR